MTDASAPANLFANLDDAGITVERGPVTPITPRLVAANRAKRRKEASIAKSAAWKRTVRNAHKAAVRKLNNESAFWASLTAAFADGAQFHSKAAVFEMTGIPFDLPVWA